MAARKFELAISLSDKSATVFMQVATWVKERTTPYLHLQTVWSCSTEKADASTFRAINSYRRLAASGGADKSDLGG